jgi:hypothetical protein
MHVSKHRDAQHRDAQHREVQHREVQHRGSNTAASPRIGALDPRRIPPPNAAAATETATETESVTERRRRTPPPNAATERRHRIPLPNPPPSSAVELRPVSPLIDDTGVEATSSQKERGLVDFSHRRLDAISTAHRRDSSKLRLIFDEPCRRQRGATNTARGSLSDDE